MLLHRLVVLYLSSTSNHNNLSELRLSLRLCYIFLLHQTTTLAFSKAACRSCVISFFYIKPQLHKDHLQKWFSCVISFFYIKPQPSRINRFLSSVVLYLSSTSNHNERQGVVGSKQLCYIFLLHQTTTRNISSRNQRQLCYIFLLHQTTTDTLSRLQHTLLCYIFLLHQTTTSSS